MKHPQQRQEDNGFTDSLHTEFAEAGRWIAAQWMALHNKDCRSVKTLP
jgi:hypothetical protein